MLSGMEEIEDHKQIIKLLTTPVMLVGQIMVTLAVRTYLYLSNWCIQVPVHLLEMEIMKMIGFHTGKKKKHPTCLQGQLTSTDMHDGYLPSSGVV